MRLCVRTILLLTLLSHAWLSSAAPLTIYDDQLQNGFLDYSYGGAAGDINFASTAQPYAGTKSIAFAGNNFNAVAAAHPTVDYSTASYPTLHFWVHGGTVGGQQLRVYLELDGGVVAQAELDSYIAGGAIVANAWREVTVSLTGAPLSYNGSFDRIDIQSDIGGAQPVLYIDEVTLEQPVAVSALLQVEHGVSVASMTSDRFTWRDSAGKQRVAVLAHNDGQVGPSSPDGYVNHGGALRQYSFVMPDNSTRTATVTTYGNGGYGGFGYVVSHRGDGTSGIPGVDDSPLGYAFTGSFQRVFEGRHHAIFRFTQNYPRYSSTTANPANTQYNVPVTIDWVFATGRDNPLWAITYNLSGVPVNALNDDSRAPYGELNIDGAGATDISGVAWGDRYKFTSTTAPLTLNSDWTWNVANSVPYVKLWIASTNATMGTVLTQRMNEQDAGGGRNPFYHDMTVNWGKTSANGNAGGAYKMPYQGEWPYQANAYSIGTAMSNPNARLTWGTQYGFLGQQAYVVNDGVVQTAPGWDKKSYSTYIVLGAHTTDPVGAQVTQIETIAGLTLSATLGSVVTSGPAGINRAETVTYVPAGYNHVYGALTFTANSNRLDANIAVSNGTSKNPLFIIKSYSGALPTLVKLRGVALVADTDYFASVRADASELWLTLAANLTGATNRLEINPGAGAVAVRGDMSGDGKLDLVLRNYATGQDALWIMNNTAFTSIVDLPALPNLNYRFEGTADFNADGNNDIVLRNYSTGQNALWLMNGTALSSVIDLPALPNTAYRFEGTGDFNADGKPDIILRNYSTGQNAIWVMNGTSVSSIADLPALPNTNFRFESAGDFNADGKPDIVIRNYSTGQNAVWLMNGTALASTVDLPALPNVNYRIDAVGDISGDGKTDLIFRNYTTGLNAVWVMNGTALSSVADLPALPNLNYEFCGPR